MSSLAGTRALVRLGLRLDRVRLPVWIAVLAALVLSTASAFAELYPTVESRTLFAVGVGSNPALRAIVGPAFDLSTIGGLTAWRTATLVAVLVAIMNLLTVLRHTRTEEEAGRLELVGSTVVGRRAALTAALAVALSANAVLGIVIAAGLIGLGLPAGGSVALGLVPVAAGLMFAAVAAVAAQLTESARAASGIASTVLGLSFLLRAIGDSAGEGGPTWLSWLSPIGWMAQTRPFAGERWWVFGLAAAFAVVLIAGAYGLVARRDLGAGLWPSRPGPARAAPGLRSPLALAWRLQRGSLAGWVLGTAVLGAGLGGIAEGVGDLLGDNPQLAQILAALGGEEGIVDAYLASTLRVVGILAAAYAVQATLRLRAEETAGRAEPLLATRVGRVQWAVSHLGLALLGTAVVLLAAGLAAGAVHGLRVGDVGGQVPRLLAAGLVQLPAAAVLAGVALALFGLAPHFTVGAWGALVAVLLVQQLGAILRWDQWVLDLSPFSHVPDLPGGELTAAPLLWLAAAAAALTAAGLLGFRRRDIG